MTEPKKLEVKGNIHEHPVAEVLAEIAQSKLSGSLRLSHSEHKVIIYFAAGDVTFAVSNARHHRLFHLLLREEKILPSQLSDIPNFANDQELKVHLLKDDILMEREINVIFAAQIRQILEDTLVWQEGSWVFNPLVRIRGDINIPADLQDILLSYSWKMPSDRIVRRFKSLQERFVPQADIPVYISLPPKEGFVFSRFNGENLSIEEVRNLSGLTEAETLQTLYTLWLGGFINRQRWNSAFTRENLSAIQSAKIELKKQASAPDALKPKPVSEALPVETDEQKETKLEITLEEYLKRVEKSLTFYEILDVDSDAKLPDIKNSYFQIAKRFHPDLFYRRVEEVLHRRIQNAFTQLAQAYETLRNPEAREVYDFKLRKEIANLKRSKASADGEQTPAELIEQQAAESFEHGFDLIMQNDHEEAVSYLARAVHLVGGNARYRAFYGKALSESKETYRQAEAEYQTALRIEPENLDYRYMLAELFIKIGLNKRAEGELRRILEKSPAHFEANSLLDSLHGK